MVRILVGDDNPEIREIVSSLIREEYRTARISVAENGEQVIGQLRSGKFDLVVLDISMPKKTCLQVLEIMGKEYISAPVIMMSTHSIDMYAEAAYKMGAATYILKDRAGEDLLPAMKFILGGDGLMIKPRIENCFSVN